MCVSRAWASSWELEQSMDKKLVEKDEGKKGVLEVHQYASEKPHLVKMIVNGIHLM